MHSSVTEPHILDPFADCVKFPLGKVRPVYCFSCDEKE